MSKLSTRASVIATLERIQHGESLASLLEPLLNQVADKDRGFAHELLLGTLRQWWALSRIGESLIENEVTDKGVWAGLNIGLYQLLYLDTPDYAAIGETVEAIKQLDKGYGAGLINAILRKVQKNPAKFRKKIEKNHSLPNWLAKQLKTDWPEYYVELGQALRHPAPIFLRLNAKFCTLAHYAQLLTQAEIAHDVVDLGVNSAQAIRLGDNINVTSLPYFAEGWVSVQDAHAQLSAYILASQNAMSLADLPVILDACAAPGGKTAHLLEMFHVKHFIALDNDSRRLQRVEENLTRLQLLGDNVSLVTADATHYRTSQPQDIILLDAPCTATGVLRRHPDIALLRQESDVAQTVELQATILANCWHNLRDGGLLLYVTCSLLKAENEQQLAKFLAEHADGQQIDFSLNLPNQIKREIGWQCLPLDPNGGDGFYYALLQKKG